MRTRVATKLRLVAAWCRAVLPFLSVALMSAPRDTRRRLVSWLKGIGCMYELGKLEFSILDKYWISILMKIILRILENTRLNT